MASSIIWSPRAKVSFYHILEYLEQKWTQKEIDDFFLRTNEVLAYIKENPLYYPYSTQSDTYRCVMKPQVSLYYHLKNNDIELLLFWDNRQNPSKLKLK